MNYNFLFKNFKDYSCLDLQKINNPYNNNNMTGDAIFKYATIIDFFKTINTNIDTLLEPGCQVSSLSVYISKTYNVKKTHLFDYDNVSGLNIKSIQETLFKLNNLTTDVNFYGGDFFSQIIKIPDYSVDVVIDGCSITHFCGNDSIKNAGLNSWRKTVNVLYKKLKKGGYFIISSDVKYDENISKTNSDGEFIYPQDIINVFINEGFEIEITPIISNDTIDNVLPYKLRVISICFIKK